MEPEAISTGTFYGKRYATVNDALEDFLSDNNHATADMVIIPPDVDTNTDEEDIDDDNIEAQGLPHDVPGEIELHVMDSDEDEEDNLPLSVIKRKLKKQKIDLPEWTSEEMDISMEETGFYKVKLNNIKESLKNCTPVELFEKMFDEETLLHIVEQSTTYAKQRNNHSFDTTQKEIKIFLGILLFSGYHKLPRERLYWSLDEDCSVPMVTNSMSRNRFQEVKRFLHIADNTKLNVNGKMAKLRPLIDKLNRNFRQWGIFHQKLSPFHQTIY